MLKDKVAELGWRRAARLAAIAAVGFSLAAAHPGAHDAARMPASEVPDATIDAATPVGTVMAFHAALASGNTDAALMHLAEDVVIFESGGVESSRAEYASHHLQADAASNAAVPRILISRTHGTQGDMAWVSGFDQGGSVLPHIENRASTPDYETR